MATSSFTSSSYYINALTSKRSWTGTTGEEATVHYNYNTRTTSHDGNVRDPKLVTASQEAATEKALQAWENVANITFVEDTSAVGDRNSLIIRQSDLGSGVAASTYTSFSGSKFASADLRLNGQYSTDYSVGSQGYKTIMHEIGHALGLKHPGDYNAGGGGAAGPFLPRGEDSFNTTIMSYNQGSLTSGGNNPTTPMIYDIAAAQFIYGANTSYNSGNTAYTFNGTKNAMTIWDGGGTDTIDASGYTGNSIVDLREGVDNVTKVGKAAIWNAFNANIENGTSGSGSDTLYGNKLNNTLTGNAGNDKLYGADGNDRLSGGGGNDQIDGGNGNDTMDGGTGNDTITSGAGNDLLAGRAGNDILYGNAGNDVFVFFAGGGDDIIKDFEAPGRTVGDVIRVDDALYTTIAQLLDAVSYSGSNAVIDLKNGDSVTISGVSSNALTVDDFQLF